MSHDLYHITFGRQAAYDLRQALKRLGRPAPVLSFNDYLSYGPIDPPDPDVRVRWVESVLDIDWWGDEIGNMSWFWTRVLSGRRRCVIWLSRRSTSDHAGFLELVWRLGDTPCDIVDLTEALAGDPDADWGDRRRSRAESLSQFSPDLIIRNDFLNQARSLSDSERRHCHQVWRRLKSENGDLRILTPDLELFSAPITFFDDLLMSFIAQRERKAAAVIGSVFTHYWADDLQQTPDWLLASRLRVLSDAGRIESCGNLWRIRNSEVKLPGGEWPSTWRKSGCLPPSPARVRA